MKRKIPVQDLRIGMYVAELDRPWLETPFLFQGFEIRTEEEITTLQRLCRHVYILAPDDAAAAGRATHLARRAGGEPAAGGQADFRALRIERDLLRINNRPVGPEPPAVTATLEGEIERIKETYLEARRLMAGLLESARLGRALDVIGTKTTVAALADSVLRNPDALTAFTLLRRKNEHTVLHSLRVCILALVFGRHLGFDRDTLITLGLGALLHDIGKVRVPDGILNKATTLSAPEVAVMKRHVEWGVEILERLPWLPAAAVEIARCHHERYDGRGYPAGIPGEVTSTFGLIGALVNAYDDMTADDGRGLGISAHAALRRIYEERGRAFHPQLAEQFIQCLGIYPVGSVVALNTGEIAVVAALNRVRRLKPRVVLVRRPDGTPYAMMPAVNLEERRTRHGEPCEIERVLEPAACGVNPAYFLPLPPLG
jgi:putative nucleotidyltransferase with HDIG domain